MSKQKTPKLLTVVAHSRHCLLGDTKASGTQYLALAIPKGSSLSGPA